MKNNLTNHLNTYARNRLFVTSAIRIAAQQIVGRERRERVSQLDCPPATAGGSDMNVNAAPGLLNRYAAIHALLRGKLQIW